MDDSFSFLSLLKTYLNIASHIKNPPNIQNANGIFNMLGITRIYENV